LEELEMSLRDLCKNAYGAETGNYHTVLYVNSGKKYISVKIDELHLSPNQITNMVQTLRANREFGYRVLRVINSHSSNGEEKVLVRFSKLPID
jgi:hypothetical protein